MYDIVYVLTRLVFSLNTNRLQMKFFFIQLNKQSMSSLLHQVLGLLLNPNPPLMYNMYIAVLYVVFTSHQIPTFLCKHNGNCTLMCM